MKKHRLELSSVERLDKSLDIKFKTNKKESIFGSKSAKKLWEKADDGIQSSRMLTELYENVPKNLQGVRVRTLEFHEFDCNEKMKTKVKKWLNRD